MTLDFQLNVRYSPSRVDVATQMDCLPHHNKFDNNKKIIALSFNEGKIKEL